MAKLHDLTATEIKEIYAAASSEGEDLDETTAARVERALGGRAALLPHQRRALLWMTRRELGATRGGVLADEPGLGKTLTCLALIASDAAHDEDADDFAGAAGPPQKKRQKKTAAPPRKAAPHPTLVIAPTPAVRERPAYSAEIALTFLN